MKHQHGGDIYTHHNCIDFSTNVNPLGMPQAVARAAMEAVLDAVHYPDPQCRRLKQAIAERECRHHAGAQVREGQIFCGNGAADVIFALVLAMQPMKALLPVPSFSEYELALRSVDCEISYYPLREEDGFRIREDILDYVKEDVDMIFLCNPNNPTGELIDRELLTRIAQRCEKTVTRLVLDECFVDFLEEPEQNTMIPVMQQYPMLFILKAFTKIFAVPGLRIGYGLCADEMVIEQMEGCAQPWRVSVPAQAAGVAACAEDTFAKEGRQYCQTQRKVLIEAMRQMGLTIFGSRANYIFFRGPADLKERMLEAGFLIRSCANYEGLGEGYFRIAVCKQKDNRKFLEALRSQLEALEGNQ